MARSKTFLNVGSTEHAFGINNNFLQDRVSEPHSSLHDDDDKRAFRESVSWYIARGAFSV